MLIIGFIPRNVTYEREEEVVVSVCFTLESNGEWNGMEGNEVELNFHFLVRIFLRWNCEKKKRGFI